MVSIADVNDQQRQKCHINKELSVEIVQNDRTNLIDRLAVVISLDEKVESISNV